MSEKIRPHHLERKAILYVRQSSVYQVNNNLESQKLQYAMEKRLRDLGWREVEVVDEDLGRSASGNGGKGRVRADGSRSLLRSSRRGGGQRSVAVRQEQPRLAKAGRGMSCGR